MISKWRTSNKIHLAEWRCQKSSRVDRDSARTDYEVLDEDNKTKEKSAGT